MRATLRFALLIPLSAAILCAASKRSLNAFPGSTPSIDGVFSPGEWGDATQFYGIDGWTFVSPAASKPARKPSVVSVHGFVKHDASHLYFAFDVGDPGVHPKDGIRILWKSPRGGTLRNLFCGVTTGLAPAARGAEDSVQCAASVTSERGYAMEWAIPFNPFVEIAPGKFYSPQIRSAALLFNLAINDFEDPASKARSAAPALSHQFWFSSATKGPVMPIQPTATLWILSGSRQ